MSVFRMPHKFQMQGAIVVAALIAGVVGASLSALAGLIPAPGRYRVEAVSDDTLLIRVDQWTGHTWVYRVEEAEQYKGQWIRVKN